MKVYAYLVSSKGYNSKVVISLKFFFDSRSWGLFDQKEVKFMIPDL